MAAFSQIDIFSDSIINKRKLYAIENDYKREKYFYGW